MFLFLGNSESVESCSARDLICTSMSGGAAGGGGGGVSAGAGARAGARAGAGEGGGLPPSPEGDPPAAGMSPLMYMGEKVPPDYRNLRPKQLIERYPCLHKSIALDPDEPADGSYDTIEDFDGIVMYVKNPESGRWVRPSGQTAGKVNFRRKRLIEGASSRMKTERAQPYARSASKYASKKGKEPALPHTLLPEAITRDVLQCAPCGAGGVSVAPPPPPTSTTSFRKEPGTGKGKKRARSPDSDEDTPLMCLNLETLKKKRDLEDIRPVCWYDGRCYETRHDHWSRFKHLKQDKPIPNTFHSVDMKFMALAFDESQ